MSKVICDICGTTYPDTADQCPICGCSRELGGMLLGNALRSGEQKKAVPLSSAKGGRFAAKKTKQRSLAPDEFEDDEEVNITRIQDKSVGYKDEEEYEEDFAGEDDDYEDEDDDEEDQDDTGVAKGLLIVFLILVIAAMLLVSGFLFFRYFLPNQLPEQEPTSVTDPVQSETEESTVPTVPCTSLALTGGAPDLSFEGQNWLLNVVVVPEDTTDVLTYVSADESVVTVTEQGRVTAVGEGETVIYITCGNITMECNVTVAYAEETEPSETTGETGEAETVEGETTEGETVEGETSSEDTEPEETKELLDIELWCNYDDITLLYRGETVTLKVNEEITLEDLEWTSENEEVATVENGVIKGTGHGKTNVIGRYGDQEVVIIVRCAFW